jgi:hypothetical protein
MGVLQGEIVGVYAGHWAFAFPLKFEGFDKDGGRFFFEIFVVVEKSVGSVSFKVVLLVIRGTVVDWMVLLGR